MNEAVYRTKKRFGQHFLIDPSIVDAIVRAINPRPGQHIIEIGPGQGVLTGPLLSACGELTVIEIDRDLAGGLHQRLGASNDTLHVIEQDVLTYGFLDSEQRVVGNLPYNISTPLLFHLFACARRIVDMHFMLQKEVVDRLVAQPGSKAYGRLSVMAQFYANMSHLFDVPPEAFDPPPKVDSAVIRLIPNVLDEAAKQLAPGLETIVRQAFSQRRKTLRNTLKGHISEDQMAKLGIDASQRAETLTLENFIALSKYYQSNKRQ